MAKPENKKKLPKHTAEPEYPWSHVTQHLCGHEDIDDNTPDHEYRRQAHTKGTFKDTGEDGAIRKLGVATKHQEVTQGHSLTVEGPNDTLDVNGARYVTTRGLAQEIADNLSAAIGGKYAKLSKEPQTRFTDEIFDHISSGKTVASRHSYGGNQYVHNDKNRTEHVDENYYLKVTKDHGIYSDKGNMDTQLTKGKLRVKTGKVQLYDSDDSINSVAKINITETADKEIIDTAGKKITLQCGSSQIIMTPNQIVIKSKFIRFEKS